MWPYVRYGSAAVLNGIGNLLNTEDECSTTTFVCFGWLVLNRLVSKRACLLHRDLPPKSQHQDLLDNQMKTDINTKAILLNSVPRSIHMVEEIADLLTEYVYDLVGDGLRTVVIVRDNDHEIRYLKDDLQREYSKEAYAEIVETFRLENPFLSPALEGTPGRGTTRPYRLSRERVRDSDSVF